MPAPPRRRGRRPHPCPPLPLPSSFYLDGGSLVLKGLAASDAGAYTCVAHNAAGEDARLHTVNVLGEREGRGGEGAPTDRGSLAPGASRALTRH